jgi:hypothetical protein
MWEMSLCWRPDLTGYLPEPKIKRIFKAQGCSSTVNCFIFLGFIHLRVISVISILGQAALYSTAHCSRAVSRDRLRRKTDVARLFGDDELVETLEAARDADDEEIEQLLREFGDYA